MWRASVLWALVRGGWSRSQRVCVRVVLPLFLGVVDGDVRTVFGG